jgi:hypothetical protein
MTVEDPELDDLFREASHMTDESRHSGRAPGAGRFRLIRAQHGGCTITLRIKPDRRSVVTRVDPEYERRRR